MANSKLIQNPLATVAIKGVKAENDGILTLRILRRQGEDLASTQVKSPELWVFDYPSDAGETKRQVGNQAP